MLKIYEVEEKYVQKLDKKVKVCVIQEEGLKYPYNRVTVWPELPIYNQIVPGYQISEGYYVESVDSKDRNPHGGFYKRRTLKQGTKTTGQDVQIQALAERIRRLEAKVGIVDSNDHRGGVEYPSDPCDVDAIPF